MNRRKFFTAAASASMLGAVSSFASTPTSPVKGTIIWFGDAQNTPQPSKRDEDWGRIDLSWSDPHLQGKLKTFKIREEDVDRILTFDRNKGATVVIGSVNYKEFQHPRIYIRPL